MLILIVRICFRYGNALSPAGAEKFISHAQRLNLPTIPIKNKNTMLRDRQLIVRSNQKRYIFDLTGEHFTTVTKCSGGKARLYDLDKLAALIHYLKTEGISIQKLANIKDHY